MTSSSNSPAARRTTTFDPMGKGAEEIAFQIWRALPNLKEEGFANTWLYRIATNESITFLNRNKLKNNVSLDEAGLDLADTLAGSSYFDGDKAQMKLQEALLTLPEKQRLVFNMKYFDDLKYEEISAILGTSVGGLKASFHLAVKKIEHYLLSRD